MLQKSESENATKSENASKSENATESESWDPKEEVNRLLNSLDENETNLTKITDVTHKALKAMSLSDACEFMISRKLPVTDENIEKFLDLTRKAYLIRLEILKQLIN